MIWAVDVLDSTAIRPGGLTRGIDVLDTAGAGVLHRFTFMFSNIFRLMG